MTTLVVEAETNPCCSHARIEQRRPLAGDVWSETQAASAGRNREGLVIDLWPLQTEDTPNGL